MLDAISEMIDQKTLWCVRGSSWYVFSNRVKSAKDSSKDDEIAAETGFKP